MGKSDDYFTISDLAEALDVKKSHIRFCEANGLISAKTIRFKRRVYSKYDRERLKLVFRFVLLGYSTEQIIELMGKPDGDLNENDRLNQGIAYGEAKIEALETHKDNSSFTRQARVQNEIEMLREYINAVKTIIAGGDDKPSEKTGISFQEETENLYKPQQHPIKVISVFIAGLVLVIFIGSFFYYRAAKEDAGTAKQVQKRAVPKDQIQTHKASEPVNLTEKPRSDITEIPKNPEPPSAGQPGNLKTKIAESPPESAQPVTSAPAAGDVSESSKVSPSAGPEAEAGLKTDAKKESALKKELKENPAAAADSEGALPASGSETVPEKADNSQ